jgi:hypothetical protein
MNILDEIVRNARNGSGPCAGCPAHKSTQGWCVNPGLSNSSGKLMFVTQEPSHCINWEEFPSWSEYNVTFTKKFITWPGGKSIQRNYLDPLSMSIS